MTPRVDRPVGSGEHHYVGPKYRAPTVP